VEGHDEEAAWGAKGWLLFASGLAVGLIGLPSLGAASVGTQVWHGVLKSGFYLGITLAVGLLVVRVFTGLRPQVLRPGHAGSYRLIEKLGEGGMGEVYRAAHTRLERKAAVKMIRPDRLGSELAQRRFEREVRAVSGLTHPNTIALYDFGRADDGRFYFAMEHLEGLDLERLVGRHGPVSAARAAVILDQALGAVGEAHERGILHRDLKPSNVFLTERGGQFDFVKVLDFGLAKEMGSGEEARSGPGADEVPLQLAAMTTDGSITGTPLYMAPEMFYGTRPPDHRADLYSLGAVGYFLIAGRPVFEADDAVQALLQHVRSQPEPLRAQGIEVSAELEAVLLQALEKDPADRFATAEHFRRALHATPEWGRWSPQEARTWWTERLSAL
jgi:eukaryotic-like serine/threonine-protein kinase